MLDLNAALAAYPQARAERDAAQERLDEITDCILAETAGNGQTVGKWDLSDGAKLTLVPQVRYPSTPNRKKQPMAFVRLRAWLQEHHPMQIEEAPRWDWHKPLGCVVTPAGDVVTEHGEKVDGATVWERAASLRMTGGKQ